MAKSYSNFIDIVYKVFGIYKCYSEINTIYNEAVNKNKFLGNNAPREINLYYDTLIRLLDNFSRSGILAGK